MRRALILLLFLLPAYLHGTTIVVPDDEQLVSKSEAVVIGVVQEVRVVSEQGAVWTHSRISVDTILKGDPPTRVVVREPGGDLGGRRTVVYGAPRFLEGERVLLFLTEIAGEHARVVDMAAGFFVQRHDTAPWERRAIDESVKLLRDDSFASPRDAVRFPEWISASASGRHLVANYLLDEQTRRIDEDFTLLIEPSVHRWKAFDRGTVVPWRTTGTQTGYEDGGREAVRTGMSSWTSYVGARILYRYDGGSTASPGGMTRSNGINEIMFGDPLGEIAGTWNPSTGGVVGLGGFSATSSGGAWTPPFAADPSHGAATIASTWEIVEANLVIQDGVAPSRDVPEFDFTELIAHELGHTLGLGHSADPLALMYYQMTGLGPLLRADDQMGARWLYPSSGNPNPPSPPASPRELTVRAQGATDVRLDWIDASSDETGFSIYMALDGAGYRVVAQAVANRTSIVIGSFAAGSRYRFVVTATNSAGESLPSNSVAITIEGAQPKASFAVRPLTGVAGLTQFQFTDQSSGPVASREWDFGDGTVSQLSDPSHVFTTAGSRNVKLTVRSSAGGVSTTTRKVIVSSPAEPPRAAFGFTPSAPTQIDEVEFLDESTGHVESWYWQFGDDTSSTEQNPKKRYSIPGTYAVTLVVSRNSEQSIATRTLTVAGSGSGSQTVSAAFELADAIAIAGRPIRFFDRSSGQPNSWYWQFGDGIFSTQQNPSHSYREAGLYSLVFRAGNQASSSATSRTIRVYPASSVLRLVVPAVADTDGGGGSSWRSDLSIFNADDVAHVVMVTLLPAEGVREVREVAIGVGETLVWGNVLRELFAMPSSSGSLIIESAAGGGRPELVVASRLFTRQGSATFGQGVQAVDARGSGFTLTGIRSDDAFRTNLGMVNAGAESTTARLIAFDASGNRLQQVSFSAVAAGFTQRALSSWFDERLVGSIRTVRIEADAEGLVPYASVVDNRTQDPVFIAAVPDDLLSGIQLLPVAASTAGAAGTQWRSELTMFRASLEDDTVSLSLVPLGAAKPQPGSIALASAETLALPDAIRFLTGTDGAGAILISPGMVIASRTFTGDSSGGSWGQGVPGIAIPVEAPRGLTSLRSDAFFRTNVGVVNLASEEAEVTLEFLGRDGELLGISSRRVSSGSLSQWSIAELLPGFSYSGVFSARITSTAALTLYASVIDNASGDPSFFLAR